MMSTVEKAPALYKIMKHPANVLKVIDLLANSVLILMSVQHLHHAILQLSKYTQYLLHIIKEEYYLFVV